MVKYKKSDGSLVDFDVNKIIQRIMASQEAVGASNFDEALTVSMAVQARFLHSIEIDRKDINTYAEELLMDCNRDVARVFIERRVRREILGESNESN